MSAVVALLAVTPLLALAQAGSDYTRRFDPTVKEGLHAVESYHMGKATSGLQHKDYARAYGEIDFMLRYFPNHPRALVMMGDLCEQWHDPRCDSEQYFRKAFDINPNATSTFVAYGVYLQKKRNYDEAIASYAKALALAPDLPDANYNLGLAYFEKKDYVQANERAQRAYELGFELEGLKRKLQSVGAWKPRPTEPQGATDGTQAAQPDRATNDSKR